MVTTDQLRAAILAASPSLPHPSQAFVASLLTRTPGPPLPSLVATARVRILAGDLASPAFVDPVWALANAFPAGIDAVDAKETRLPRDVTVQVLDITDLARPRWDELEELECIGRGEARRGRKIVRLPVGGDAEGDRGGGTGDERVEQGDAAMSSRRNATHRLVLQDARGVRVYALEMQRNPARIGIGVTHIGEKLVLRSGTLVARGTVLLEADKCTFLGAKVAAWDKAWADARLARLREVLGVVDRPRIESGSEGPTEPVLV